MNPFNYIEANSIDHASTLLKESRDSALLAGGMSLLPLMKLGNATPSDLIDISKQRFSKGISKQEDHLIIGAGETHQALSQSNIVKENIPALADLAANIGDPAVRARGTLGGSLAFNDPAADYPSAILALNSQIITNQRTIDANDFFTGAHETSLSHDEIITSVKFPIPEMADYTKQRGQASHFPICGIFTCKINGKVQITAIGASKDGVFCVNEIAQAVANNCNEADILSLSLKNNINWQSTIHGSAAYRKNLVLVLASRSLKKLELIK